MPDGRRFGKVAGKIAARPLRIAGKPLRQQVHRSEKSVPARVHILRRIAQVDFRGFGIGQFRHKGLETSGDACGIVLERSKAIPVAEGATDYFRRHLPRLS